ncbi:MAG: hypothetical protein NC078_09855 [Ruminococcus sp.]|nr:hypothetical protein [Ruminococcus sp.]
MHNFEKTLPVLFCAAVLTSCQETPKIPPTDNLSPVTNPVTTRSTYTGTTVEYIPTSPAPQRRNSLDMPDMPEFPDIDMQAADNPFDSDFYAMFNENAADFPDFSVAPEDDSGEQLPADLTSVPYTGPEDISVSREDVPEEEMTDLPVPRTVPVETAFPGATMPDFTFSYPAETTVPAVSPETVTETGGDFPQTDPFDIRDYMPDMGEFPAFDDVEFDTAPRS